MNVRSPQRRLVKCPTTDQGVRKRAQKNLDVLFRNAETFVAKHVLEAVKKTLLAAQRQYHFTQEDLEDITQICLIKVWQEQAKYEAEHPRYFGRIVKNTVVDHLRTHSKEAGFRAVGEWNSLSQKEEEVMRGALRLSYSKHELDARITRILNDEEAAVLSLRFYEDYNYEEIAGVLGLSKSTIKRRLFNALLKLQRVMRSEGVSSISRHESRYKGIV
jgi:RNA polymerase sigma factor (sigma-70 family)